MTELGATIARCFEHVERIENESRINPAALSRALNNSEAVSAQISDIVLNCADPRMTVREYRDMQKEGFRDPLSPEGQELWRMRKK